MDMSGKCKVNIRVNCNCRLIVQGSVVDAVPGDYISIGQANPSIPTAFFIEVMDIVNIPVK